MRSTITRLRTLAEAFAHRPTRVCVDDAGSVSHNGAADGYLYLIAEPVADADIEPVPRSAMPGLEWHTRRPPRVQLIAMLPARAG